MFGPAAADALAADGNWVNVALLITGVVALATVLVFALSRINVRIPAPEAEQNLNTRSR